MFPETCFRNCFLVLPCFHAARKHEMFLPCSRSKFCFLETKLTLETMLPVWQNWETLGKHARATGVSGNMFPRFARPLQCKLSALEKYLPKLFDVAFCFLLNIYFCHFKPNRQIQKEHPIVMASKKLHLKTQLVTYIILYFPSDETAQQISVRLPLMHAID